MWIEAYFQISLIVIIHLHSSFSIENCNEPRIAIVGAGIGGASAAHYMSKLFNNKVKIDIFEQGELGGRLATITMDNREYEAGGAVIHPRNKYMKNFLQLLNLKKRPTSENDGSYGIWNGNEFVFQESSWEIFTILKLMYRYGWQPISLYNHVNSILDDFEKIYELQEKGIGFHNVTALIGAMNKDFVDMLQVSMNQYLQNLGYKQNIIDELVKATLVVNYGQDTNVQSFVGCVSVAGAGSGLWSVKNGNKEIPGNLILENHRTTVIYGSVTKISKHFSSQSLPQYEVFFNKNEKDADDINSKVYDIIVIACPLRQDQDNLITFNGFNVDAFKFSEEYQTTFTTFVTGNLNYSYFKLSNELIGILSCEPEKTIISSIGSLTSVTGEKPQTRKVWKIFSRNTLSSEFLEKMFLQIYEIKEKVWKAYPKYSSNTHLHKFVLDDFFYHVNAIEWAASAMEMSAIGGRNVANLAFIDYSKVCFNVSKKTNHSKENKRYKNISDL